MRVHSGTIWRGLFGLLLFGISCLGHYVEGPGPYVLFYAICSGLMLATVIIDLKDSR